MTLAYFSIASLCMGTFYSCYWLFLRQNTFFGLNRSYLLASIVLSLGLPLIELPDSTAASLPIRLITLPTFVVSNNPAAESAGWAALQWVWLGYGIGVTLMLLRLGLTSWAVFRIIRRGTIEYKDNYSLVRLPDEKASHIPSFSFGRYLVLNHTDGLTPPPALLRHEEAHIRQLHTIDILFLEVVCAFFWFNPVLWFYKSALQEVHEFLADRAAIRQLSTNHAFGSQTEIQPTYARQLVAYALQVPITALTTPFASQSMLKQRLLMLQKPVTHRWALLRYVLTLPLAASLLMCTQAENDLPLNGSGLSSNQVGSRKAVKVDGEVFTVVEQQPEFPGGMAQLSNYLHQNLQYPAAAQKVNAEGRVFVSFIVTKTGEVTDVKILKDVGFGTGEEASRVVAQMPRWIPARQNGQLVNVRYNLPINFQLDNKVSEQVSNDFWNGLSEYKAFTLDGKKIDKSLLKNLINQGSSRRGSSRRIYISFYIDDKTNTVVFNHVNS